VASGDPLRALANSVPDLSILSPHSGPTMKPGGEVLYSDRATCGVRRKYEVVWRILNYSIGLKRI
jgi:hypothetical protein